MGTRSESTNKISRLQKEIEIWAEKIGLLKEEIRIEKQEVTMANQRRRKSQVDKEIIDNTQSLAAEQLRHAELTKKNEDLRKVLEDKAKESKTLSDRAKESKDIDDELKAAQQNVQLAKERVNLAEAQTNEVRSRLDVKIIKEKLSTLMRSNDSIVSDEASKKQLEVEKKRLAADNEAWRRKFEVHDQAQDRESNPSNLIINHRIDDTSRLRGEIEKMKPLYQIGLAVRRHRLCNELQAKEEKTAASFFGAAHADAIVVEKYPELKESYSSWYGFQSEMVLSLLDVKEFLRILDLRGTMKNHILKSQNYNTTTFHQNFRRTFDTSPFSVNMIGGPTQAGIGPHPKAVEEHLRSEQAAIAFTVMQAECERARKSWNDHNRRGRSQSSLREALPSVASNVRRGEFNVSKRKRLRDGSIEVRRQSSSGRLESRGLER